jgi:hypothetical protein
MMESPDGTRKRANTNKQNEKKSLGIRASGKCLEEYDQYGNALDQDNVYSLAKKKPGIILEWKIL